MFMSTLRSKFGERLKDIRQARGFTQEELAESLNMSVEFVSLLERGVNGPSFDTLEKLAAILQVEVKELFDFE